MYTTLRSHSKTVLLSICFVWAVINIGNLFVRPVTFTDFFSYWLGGQYIRQEINPYTEFARDTRTHTVEKDSSFVRGDNLSFPIRYLAGPEDTQSSLYALSSTHSTGPTNTAPMMLITAGLSYFAWPVASKLWFFLNILLGFGIIWLTFHYVEQSGLKLTPFLKALLILAFWGLDATRSSLQQGQTTIMTMFTGFLALYLIDRNHHTWAGVALGIALSKYNMTLPSIFLLLLYKREFKVSTVAILTQVAAILTISLLTQTTITDNIQAYVTLADFAERVGETMQYGVNVGAYFKSGIWNMLVFTGLLSLLTLGYLATLLYRQKANNERVLTHEQVRLVDIHLLSIFTLLSLLAVHHLKYDIILLFVCLCLFVLVALDKTRWNITSSTQNRFIAFTIFATIPLMVSFVITHYLNTGTLARLAFATQTASLVILLMTSFWLLKRFLSQQRLEPAHS